MTEEPKRDIGTEFEEEVRTFLQDKLGLEDVKGGPDFHIGPPNQPNQIDACGRFGKYLFVFECKAAGKRINKDMRKEILACQTRAQWVVDNYKRIKEYCNCILAIYIFITKKIDVPPPNIDLCKEIRPKIWYADEGLLGYYSDLHDKIGKFAIYNFLADFGVRPPPYETITVPALRTKLGKYKAFSFFINPKELIKFSYVARRRSKQEDFYQRMLEGKRIKKIQNFIDSGGVFPSSLVISIKKGEVEFSPSEECKNYKESNDCFLHSSEVGVGLLTIKSCYDACWIIDGQHRLFSFANSKSLVRIPCVAFVDMEFEKERAFFLEINREQKPIQSDLIWDLEGQSYPQSPRGIISNAVRMLNKMEESPFFDDIYIPIHGPKLTKRLTMTSLCNGIRNAGLANEVTQNCLGRKNWFFDQDPEIRKKRLARVIALYFRLIGQDLNEIHKDFALGNAGVSVFLYLLEPIMAKLHRHPVENDFKVYTKIIKAYFEMNHPTLDDIKKLKESTTGEGGRRALAKEIGLMIIAETKDADFWPAMEESDISKEIVQMERRIGRLIATKLSEKNSNWERQRVPESIRVNAFKKAEKDGTSFEENFDLGEEKDIVFKKDNWEECFKDIFISKNGFLNQEEMALAFQYLSLVRNPILHGKTQLPSKEQLKQCKMYLQKMDRIIPESADDSEKES